MVLMIPLSFFLLCWRASLLKCISLQCKCPEQFSQLWGKKLISVFIHFVLPFLILPNFSPSSISRCFCPPYVFSIVWRLHPGQLWHHPVPWLPRLLPTQPELHVDNRDLPWQRWAEHFCVNACISQLQFPLQCHLPLPSGPFLSCRTRRIFKTGVLRGWPRAAVPRDNTSVMSPFGRVLTSKRYRIICSLCMGIMFWWVHGKEDRELRLCALRDREYIISRKQTFDLVFSLQEYQS